MMIRPNRRWDTAPGAWMRREQERMRRERMFRVQMGVALGIIGGSVILFIIVLSLNLHGGK